MAPFRDIERRLRADLLDIATAHNAVTDRRQRDEDDRAQLDALYEVVEDRLQDAWRLLGDFGVAIDVEARDRSVA